MNLIKKPSPNYESRKGIIPCLIVDHITGGDRASSALNWFANPQSQTSSNYIVDTNGDVYECVPLEYAPGAKRDNYGLHFQGVLWQRREPGRKTAGR